MKFACRMRRGFTRYLNGKITIAGGLAAHAHVREYISIYTRVSTYIVYFLYYDSR